MSLSSRKESWHRASALAWLMLLTLPTACEGTDSSDGAGGQMPSADRLVKIPGGSLEMGFSIGFLRQPASVNTFTISKFPVTRGEFQACVDAGDCDYPSSPLCRSAQDDVSDKAASADAHDAERPVTCVGVDQARRYCAWVGAKLPVLEQWMLAARGPTVARYPWGSSEPTCERHPVGLNRVLSGEQPNDFASMRIESCKGADIFSVGKHQAGASSMGIQDVLLTPAELLQASSESVYGACKLNGGENGAADAGDLSSRACLVYGLRPGAIDSVQALAVSRDANGKTKGDLAQRAYGFRCVWDEEARK